jgi:WD40 repeat protein
MMKPTCLLLLAAAVAVTAFGPVTPAVGDDAKVVRLAWFPRFSPDGSLVLSAHGSWEVAEGGEARLFAANDGTVRHVFRHPRGVRTVAWSPRGEMFVTGAYGNGIRGFDAKSYKELFHLAKAWNVENLRISSDDKLLAASFGSGDIRLYDITGRQEVHLFRAAHKGGIWGMALAPNDALLASGGKDSFANLFDLAARKKVRSIKHPGEVNGVVFTPDSRHLVTGCADARIRVFDATTGEQVGTLQGHKRGTVTDLQFTSDGKLLASAGADGTVRIWDTSDLKNATLMKTLEAHDGLVFGVAISPDDRRLVSAGWDDRIKMWDLRTGELLWTWKRD